MTNVGRSGAVWCDRRRFSSYLWRGKAKIFPVPWSPRVAERNTDSWRLFLLCQCKEFVNLCKVKPYFVYVWVCLPSLPAGKLRRVIRSHATRHWCQELLPLLLDQSGCADYLVARRPQVRPVHLLRQIFHHHLQVGLGGNKENMQTPIYSKGWKFKLKKRICNVYLTLTVDTKWADYLTADIIQP